MLKLGLITAGVGLAVFGHGVEGVLGRERH